MLLDGIEPAQAERVSAFAYGLARGYGKSTSQLSGLHPFEEDFLARFGGQRVYVPACGGGRELHALIDRGYQVVGAEPADALRRAASALIKAPVGAERLQDLIDAEPPDSPFELVIIGWGAWGHICEGDSRVAILRAMLAWVEPQGALCVSWPREQPRGQLTVTASGAIVDGVSLEDLSAEAERAGWSVVHAAGRAQGSYPHAFLKPGADAVDAPPK